MLALKEENRFARRSNLAAIVAGGISATLGLVVLVGWYTGTVVLVQVHRAFAPMQYNPALGFLLCGVGLLSVVYGRRRLAIRQSCARRPGGRRKPLEGGADGTHSDHR